ncbi:putative homogentisate 1,2-dioxygenase [Triangularia verruculosa]|uniref:homogentisate 1,2-dioxygenase n=1 Tax=Triangularia verruculosa TaxID=2587418 RepID=A0AAN6XKF4_9PEZI|nr:putative homogentisate 1,2-dioxygenase [Triangularia verruculosa]
MPSQKPSICPANATHSEDPYKYQCGFGNHHVTEAIPGVLPPCGTNLPQKCRYGLYAEQLNGTPFISPRNMASSVWMYRGKPAAAHHPPVKIGGGDHIESCFLSINSNATFTPLSYTWGPLKSDQSLASTAGPAVTFVQGLKTIGGHGDATLKEGLAVHQYAFDTDMHQQAFSNHDGELLLIPQHGTLDIKTELGNLRVKPEFIVVLPPGIRFSVNIVRALESPMSKIKATGYALEVFGTRFTLPDLGVLGANGLAHPRDFEYPMARFDHDAEDDGRPFCVTIKLAGRLFSYTQPHTPFDVVAWNGKYAPYRYDLSRFCHLTANTDQLDPTSYCVLTAPSKGPGMSLVDFCIFGDKWAVSRNTLRIPYYHRNIATELCGVIRGQYPGSVRPLEAGGLSFEQSYMPHGETYEAHRKASEAANDPVKLGGSLFFMFNVSSHLALTRWATEEHPDIRLERPGIWDSMKNHFAHHLQEANACLSGSHGQQTLTPPKSPDGRMLIDTNL